MSENTGSANVAGNPPGNGEENKPWYSGIQDEGLRGKVELKGWKSPDDALSSYFNLESKLGAPPDRLLKLPEKPDDPAWSEIHKKLGFVAPDSPDEYELPIPEGFNEDYSKAVAAKAKELGIPKHMLKGLAEFNNDFVAKALEADDQAREQRHKDSLSELRMEWGGKYDSTVALAQRAEELVKKETGITDDSLKAWQDADPKGYYKMLAHFGSRLAEARLIEGAAGAPATGDGMSPEAAKAKLSELMRDKDFFGRWQRGETQARSQWKALNAIIAGAQQ